MSRYLGQCYTVLWARIILQRVRGLLSQLSGKWFNYAPKYLLKPSNSNQVQFIPGG